MTFPRIDALEPAWHSIQSTMDGDLKPVDALA
jgi:hypothetical protein